MNPTGSGVFVLGAEHWLEQLGGKYGCCTIVEAVIGELVGGYTAPNDTGFSRLRHQVSDHAVEVLGGISTIARFLLPDPCRADRQVGPSGT